MNKNVLSESIVIGIRHRTHKRTSSEEKIRIVLEGLRGEGGRKCPGYSRAHLNKFSIDLEDDPTDKGPWVNSELS